MKMLVELSLKLIGFILAAIGGTLLIIIDNSSSLSLSQSVIMLLILMVAGGITMVIFGYLLHFVRWCENGYSNRVRPMQRH